MPILCLVLRFHIFLKCLRDSFMPSLTQRLCFEPFPRAMGITSSLLSYQIASILIFALLDYLAAFASISARLPHSFAVRNLAAKL